MLLFLILLIACAAAAATGVIFPPGEWYRSLRKPDYTPPNWVFPAAWGVLYLLIAWAGARIGMQVGAELALGLWAAQIALNTLWTPVFFGAHRIFAGLCVIVFLWLVSAALTIVAFRFDILAGLALILYMAWLSLATALNYRIWRDNPDAPR